MTQYQGLFISDNNNNISSSNSFKVTPNGVIINSDQTINGNQTITGDLTVTGSTNLIATTNTVIRDNLIELNNGVTDNQNDSGILIERGSAGDNAFLGWDESEDKFIMGTTTQSASSTGDINVNLGTLQANLTGDTINTTNNATTGGT